MKKFSKIMVILTGFFAISLFNSAVLNAEMIEPTRTLKKTSADPGQLTVFSEPPGQVVKIDGAPVGKTPLRIQEVVPGAHRLQVSNSITEINLEPGTAFHISLFKNKFIQFQVVKKEPEQQSETKRYPKTETWAPEPSPEQLKTKEQNRKAWDRWVQFVNGSSRHF
jgi:hypothetical protein